MSIVEIIHNFLRDADVTRATRETYARWLVPWHRFVINNNVDMLNTEKYQISDYKKHLLKTHTEKTVNCYLTAIRMLYRYMMDNDMIKVNPTTSIRFVKIHNTYRKHPLTLQQAIDLINSCNNTSTGNRNRLIITLMIQTGLRAIEVSRLKWEHLTKRGILVHGKGHTSADYELALDAGMMSQIKQQSFKTGSLYVFTTIHGKPMTSRYISEIVNDQIRYSGIDSDKITCHSLRHTKAVLQMKANGNNIFQTNRAMRHSDIKTTQIYLQSIMSANTEIDTSAHEINKILTTAMNESRNMQKQAMFTD